MVVTLAATEMVLAVKLSEELVVMAPATSKSLVNVLSDTAPNAPIPLELTVKAWLFDKLRVPTLLAWRLLM